MSHLRVAMKTSPDRWTQDQLSQLRAVELEVLCRLLGVAHSGTKPAKIARLLDLADLRGILATYDRPGQMTPFFSRATLAQMCRRAGVYSCLNKYGLAAGLLSWRNDCRRRGQEFHAELRAASAQRPRQLRLPLD
jgi:hypothetical protein